MLELTDAGQYFPPRALEIIALRNRDVQQSFDGFHVLRLHLSKVVQEGELSQSRNESIAFQLHVEEACNPDRTLEAIQTEFDDL